MTDAHLASEVRRAVPELDDPAVKRMLMGWNIEARRGRTKTWCGPPLPTTRQGIRDRIARDLKEYRRRSLPRLPGSEYNAIDALNDSAWELEAEGRIS